MILGLNKCRLPVTSGYLMSSFLRHRTSHRVEPVPIRPAGDNDRGGFPCNCRAVKKWERSAR